MTTRAINNFYKSRVQFDVCELVPHLNAGDQDVFLESKPVNFRKQSASETNVANATIIYKSIDGTEHKLNVVAKFYLEDESTMEFKMNRASLKYEADVYKYIANNILKPQLCPNFVGYVGFGYCNYNDVKRIFDLANLTGESKKVGILLTNAVMSTEHTKVQTLFEWYTSRPHDLIHVLFQLFYALAVMENFKIAHNDLHANNIFVETLKQHVNLCYSININGMVKKFKIRTKHILYIYDWDMAYVEELGDNLKLCDKAYAEIDVLNHFDAKKDYLRLSRTIYKLFKFLDKYIDTDQTYSVKFNALSTQQLYNANMFCILNKLYDLRVLYLSREDMCDMLGYNFLITNYPTMQCGIFSINSKNEIYCLFESLDAIGYNRRPYYISQKTLRPIEYLCNTPVFLDLLDESPPISNSFCYTFNVLEQKDVNIDEKYDETEYFENEMFLPFQTQNISLPLSDKINKKHFKIAFEWLGDICIALKLTYNCYINTAYLFLSYVAQYGVPPSSELQKIISISLYYVACLYKNIYSVDPEKLCYVTANTVKENEVMPFLNNKLVPLKFNLLYTTFDYNAARTMDIKLKNLMNYIIFCNVANYEIYETDPAQLSTDVYNFSVQIINRSQLQPNIFLESVKLAKTKDLKIYKDNKKLHDTYF